MVSVYKYFSSYARCCRCFFKCACRYLLCSSICNINSLLYIYICIYCTWYRWTPFDSQTAESLSSPNLLPESITHRSDMRIYEGLFLICICIFAFSGNTLLCTIILRTRSLRNNSNYLILCLSTSDIVVAVVNMPMTIYAIFYGSWPFSKISCVVLGYINMVSFVASVMSLTAISINRYFRICRSLQFKSMFTLRKTILMGFGK